MLVALVSDVAKWEDSWDILKGRLKPVPAIAALHPEATVKERE
jgi:hypothetical protein